MNAKQQKTAERALRVCQCVELGVRPRETDKGWFWNEDGTLMAIYDIDGVYYISIRATRFNRLKDVFRILAARKDEHGRHKGFWRHFKPMNLIFAQWLAERDAERDTDKPMVFCGHSLGGAAVIHAAKMALSLGLKVDGIYTFGQPRVGNRKFFENAGLDKVPYFCFTNGGDIVPHLPFRWMGYIHCGTRIHLGNTKRPFLDHELFRYAEGMKERYTDRRGKC